MRVVRQAVDETVRLCDGFVVFASHKKAINHYPRSRDDILGIGEGLPVSKNRARLRARIGNTQIGPDNAGSRIVFERIGESNRLRNFSGANIERDAQTLRLIDGKSGCQSGIEEISSGIVL